MQKLCLPVGNTFKTVSLLSRPHVVCYECYALAAVAVAVLAALAGITKSCMERDPCSKNSIFIDVKLVLSKPKNKT